MRILLAEDEKELSKALVAILKHNNYSIDAVYNGEDALDYALCENYDAIILDIMMLRKTVLKFWRNYAKKKFLLPSSFSQPKQRLKTKLQVLIWVRTTT